MTIEYQVFDDVRDVVLAGQGLHGVAAVRLARRRAELRAAGDGELHESVARGTACGLSGTIAMLDSAAALAAVDLAGELSFTWHDARGDADRSVTVSGVSVVSVESGGAAAPGGVVRFVAESPDGVSDPVTVA